MSQFVDFQFFIIPGFKGTNDRNEKGMKNRKAEI